MLETRNRPSPVRFCLRAVHSMRNGVGNCKQLCRQMVAEHKEQSRKLELSRTFSLRIACCCAALLGFGRRLAIPDLPEEKNVGKSEAVGCTQNYAT